MDTRISGLLKALIHYQLIDLEQALCFQDNAASANIDCADYLLHHTHLDSEHIADICAHYFGLPRAKLPALQDITVEDSILYYSQDGQSCAAIYKPQDMAQLRHHAIGIISAKEFHKLKRKLSQHPVVEYDEQGTIEKLNAIIHNALHQRASDIHIEPFYTDYHIRLRIDGILTHYRNVSHALCVRMLTRLKVLSKIDITQTRMPQDGGFSFSNASQRCDCRISFCPTIWGEKCVIRLLESHKPILQFHELGLSAEDNALLLKTIHNPQGLILVTGPTGSGKTQTLYTLLNHLNTASINISTLEDPVEIKLNGINQIHINENIGLTFATVLRSLLRQDPDVIMIGEIRDAQTAELAIAAAHTGHLVLATLHTQNAIEALSRLEHLGIKRHDIATTLKLVIAQRLIRTVINAQHGGRTGLFELLCIDNTLANSIANHEPIHRIRQIAMQNGYIPLSQAGMQKVRLNQTTLNELKRVINLDETTYAY